MICQIRKNNLTEFENKIRNAQKIEILFAEEVLLQKGFIECCENIEDIEIYGSKIGKDHDKVLHQILLNNKSLTKLDLNCTITSSLFLSALNQTKIKELYITHLVFHKTMVDKLCTGLIGSKLLTLDLSYNDFDSTSFEKICTSLKNTKVKYLFLCCCNITIDRADLLFAMLPQSRIQYLDLFRNDVQDQGVRTLCALLERTKLNFLDLGKNNLTNMSLKDMARVLPTTKLQHLWVNDYGITSSGIQSIYDIVSHTYLTNFQFPFRLMNRFEFIPYFLQNRRKVRHYNETVHFRNFLTLMEFRNVFTPEVLFVPGLSEMIMTFF